MFMRWMYPYWKPEGEGGPGAGGEGGTPGSGGGAPSGEQPLSLRAQLASQLDEGERDPFNKWAEGYTTDKDFVKSAVLMRTQFDARVPVPDEKAKPEAWDKYFSRVGKPATPKDYAYDFGKDEEGKPRELPDTDRARLEAFKEYAHKEHYTQKQFEAGLKFLEEDTAKQETEFAATIDRARGESEAALKSKWGPDFEANIEAAIDGGVAFAPDEQSWVDFVNLPLANGMRVGDHPTLLETMAKIGRASAEDQRVRNMRSSGEADTIQTQIAAIEQEARKDGKSTSVEPYYSRLRGLYKKLEPKTMTGGSIGGGYG